MKATTSTDTNSESPAFYTAFPDSLAAIVREQEQSLITTLTASPALALELAETLHSYRRWALAALRAITMTAPATVAISRETIADYLRTQATKESEVLVSNANTRIENTQRAAESHWRDFLAYQGRKQRQMGMEANR